MLSEPYTLYKVWVKAYTHKTEGESSRTLEFRTDVSGPNAPLIVNLTCQSNDALHVQWERPSVFYNSIDYYFIYYRSEHRSDTEFEEIAISAGGVNAHYDHDVSQLLSQTYEYLIIMFN